MRVDLASLGTFNRIGTAGAARAADALEMLTDVETVVETTKIHFAPVGTVTSLVGAAETAVSIEFDGGLEGVALLVFEESSAEDVRSSLTGVPTDPTSEPLHEVTNILTSSFVDGWADHLDEIIDISTPSAVDAVPSVPGHPDSDDFSFVFQSDIGIGSRGDRCRFYLVPDPADFLSALDAAGDGSPETDVQVDELSTFIRLTAAGAETVASNLETMTGIETDVAVSHLDLVPVEDVPGVVDTDQHVGTVFEFSGAMEGYLAVLFEGEAGTTIVDALAPGDSDEAMRRSAIEEIGNITASGFIDGWANALDVTIDHSVPDFVDDMARAVIESIAAELGLTQEFAYVFDVIVTADEPMTCRLFAFPDEDSFRSVVSRLDADLDVSSVERV